MTELAALNVKINGDSADLQSDLAKASKQLSSFDAQANKANKGTKGFSGSMGRLGRVSRQTRASITNTSYQLQDIAVQLSMGTRASTVFAQQLPQLASGFGTIGAVVGVLAGVGIPALAFAFSAAGESAKTFDDALSDIQDTIDSMEAPMKILNMTTEELVEKYGAATERVLQFAIAQAELAASQAARRLQEEILLLDDVASKYTAAQKAGRDYKNTIDRIAKDFGLARDEAKRFEVLLGQISAAETFEGQQAALQQVLTFLEENNVELAKIPPELQRAISEMITLSSETDRARQFMDQLAAASQNVTTGVPLYLQGFTDEQLLPPGAPPDGGGGRGRRGGGGGADPLISELESVQNALMTQEEQQIASFQRQQATLQQALEQRLLTQQEYNALMEQAQSQHADKMTAIDAYRYGTDLQKADQFLGDMASAFQSGNEDMLRISKAFGAAQALVSAFTGAAEALKLPFPGNLAAFAKVLATGLGAVQSIKGVTPGGGGASAAGAVASAAAAPSAAPLDVRLSGMSADEFISGASLESLFNRLQDEAGDRGLRVSFA
jgi:hypothetical protein